MPNQLLENLNPEQKAAVIHSEGPLLIVAGAGTGKTTVITKKIAYLVAENLAKPEEILALTFTEKAAGEMEERVDKLLPYGYTDLWISTFHSFAERILREHCLDIGLPGGFKLFNEYEQWALVRKNLDKFDLDYYRPRGNPTKFIHALIRHFSRLKDEDIAAHEYLEFADKKARGGGVVFAGSDEAEIPNNKSQIPKKIQNLKKAQAVGNSPLSRGVARYAETGCVTVEDQEVQRIKEVAGAYAVYNQLLLDNSALDFGDLINYCLKLFRERPGILLKYQQQFKYILVDEFQDTNLAQYELVKILAKPKNNIIVVGDDDQSVYRFRGASTSNILQFKTDFPEARDLILTQNYRSRQGVLDLAYEFIQLNNPNRLEYQLNQNKKKKTDAVLSKRLEANLPGAADIAVIEGANLEDEVRQVIERIADLKIADKEATWGDFAILVRANDSAKDFCAVLEEAGLPYVFMASSGLYNKPIIMDIVAFLKMLDNYHESGSLYRVLNLPIFGFSHTDLVQFNHLASKKAWSLFETLKHGIELDLSLDQQKKANAVLEFLNKHTKLAAEKGVIEIVLSFLKESGYLKRIVALPEKENIEVTNVLNAFLRRLQKFEAASDDRTAKAFLEEFAIELESGEEGAIAPNVDEGPEAVRVMTIHASKGLEFKYVFVANMVDKRFPTIERHDPIQIPDELVKEIVGEGDIHLEEERRLFYVAATRAKIGLYFSWAPDYGGARAKKPSRFLVEAKLISEGAPTPKKKMSEKGLELMLSQKVKVEKEVTETKQKSAPSTQKVFSFSQLAAFSNCPYQYRFAHILKIPRLGKGQFSFGKTMHSVLQKTFEMVMESRESKQADLFSSDGVDFNKMQQLYKENWIDDWYDSAEQKEEYRAKGETIIKDFHEKHQANWPQPVFIEKGFNIKLSAGKEVYSLKGTIDRIDEVEGGIKIVDYKTGNAKTKLEASDKEQLFIYQMAAEELFGKKVVSLAFYYLEDNTELEFLGTEKELDKLKEKMVTEIQEILKGDFPPKPGMMCKYCDFMDICEFRKI